MGRVPSVDANVCCKDDVAEMGVEMCDADACWHAMVAVCWLNGEAAARRGVANMGVSRCVCWQVLVAVCWLNAVAAAWGCSKT